MAGREVIDPTRPTVDVTGAAAGLSVGPDDLLVLAYPDLTEVEAADIRAQLEKVLPGNRFVIMVGDVELAKVHTGGRPTVPGAPTCDRCGQVDAVADVLGTFVCMRCMRWYDGAAWHAREPEPPEQAPKAEPVNDPTKAKPRRPDARP